MVALTYIPGAIHVSSMSVYREFRRIGLQARKPELFGSRKIYLLASRDMSDAENILEEYRGRVWIVTLERPQLLPQIGFELIFESSPYLNYNIGDKVMGPAVYMRPAR